MNCDFCYQISHQLLRMYLHLRSNREMFLNLLNDREFCSEWVGNIAQGFSTKDKVGIRLPGPLLHLINYFNSRNHSIHCPQEIWFNGYALSFPQGLFSWKSWLYSWARSTATSHNPIKAVWFAASRTKMDEEWAYTGTKRELLRVFYETSVGGHPGRRIGGC